MNYTINNTFPLIPLPRKEATRKRSLNPNKLEPFPLIPLPRKEATNNDILGNDLMFKFPLIPLPRKEATRLVEEDFDGSGFH